MYEVPKNLESPLKSAFDAIDNANPSWGYDDYKSYAKEQCNDEGVANTTNLLLADWQWRADHMSFVTASISGAQRSGKSRTFIYFCLMLGKIFGVPFKPTDIYWNPFTLMNAIQHSTLRQTLMRDEDSRQRAGMMSGYVEDALSTYQDQLGKRQNNLLFAAVRKSEGSDIFRFETRSINFGENGLPMSFDVVLLTPHYDDASMFVLRGYLRVPNPYAEFLDAYEKQKDLYLDDLKNRRGDYFADIDEMAEKVIALKEPELITKNSLGLTLPVNNKLTFLAAKDIVGTFHWTNQGTDLLVAKLKRLITVKYASENERVLQAIEERKKEAEETRQQNFQEAQKLLAERHAAKVKLATLQAEAEKKKQELEEKRLGLMAKKIKLDEENRLAKEKRALEEKNKVDDFKEVKKALEKR